jgi:tRNA 2-thiouridine synthesizing protein A
MFGIVFSWRKLYCYRDQLYKKRIMTIKADKKLDCLGLFCPEPVFNTRLQLDQMEIGETLEVIADDPAAKSDIENLAKNLGQEVLESVQEGEVTRIVLKKVK